MLDYFHWFANLPPELATFLIAALPISELRGALPLGYTVYNLSFLSSFFWAFLGNVVSVAVVLAILEPVSQYLSRHFLIFKRFFEWLFARTRKKNSRKFERWGSLALIAFVAIPLPVTGGWTGAVAAFVFGIPYKKSLPLIALGIFIAGIIVGLLTLAGARVLSL